MGSATVRHNRPSKGVSLAVWWLLIGAACGDGAAPGADRAVDTAVVQPGALQRAALGRKGPTLASTIYNVGCTVEADCVVVPTGDVCSCAGWGAIQQADLDLFMQRRARLGSRCAGSAAAFCEADPKLWEPRCRANQCVADHPRSLDCVEQVLPTTMPVYQPLPISADTHDPALSACPLARSTPSGPTQVWLLRPGVAGKYRISLEDRDPNRGAQRWLFVRTPDCNSPNVICRGCAANTERCFADEVLGPDDTAVIVVRNCDDRCVLRVGRWDANRPFEPPLTNDL